MKRSPATPVPTYAYTFIPLMNELKSLNNSYATLLDEVSKHSMNQNLHDAKWDRQGCYSAQLNSQLLRESEALMLENNRIQKQEVLLTAQIQVVVGKAFALFTEMILELQYDDCNLSVDQFKVFLHGYKELIENSNGLPYCKSNIHFADVLASINKYC